MPRLNRWLCASLLLACSTAVALAQRITLAEKDVEQVRIESVEITAEVTGRVAVTTYTVLFRNPNTRTLEGLLEFPLLDRQTVVRFALDVNGGMREAVPVEKEKGRVVFDEGESRNADASAPAAVSVFRARIFPLPAAETRRVRITCQEELLPGKDETLYRLNLDFPKLKHFRLALNVHTGASLPALARTTLNLQLPPWRDAQYMEFEREDFDARGVFEVALPKAERPRLMSGSFAGSDYFYAEVPSTPLLFTRPTPKAVGIIWDSSLTGRERDHEKEFSMLDAWFAETKNVDVRLIRVRDRVTREGVYSIRNGDWQALRKELAATVYDGATSLDGLIDEPRVDAWFIFTDGFFNYGTQTAPKKLALQGAVHAIAAHPRSATHWLKSIAAHGNGEYVDLNRTDPAAAAFTLQTQSMRILALDFDAADISEVYPQVGAQIHGDTFSLSGILHKRSATLRVLVGNNRENATSIELPVRMGEDRTDLAPRAWAAAKIEHLSSELEVHRLQIRELSQRFGMATSTTTLRVLETVDDYVRNNIEPPAELKDEWDARRQASRLPKRTIDDHLESVVHAFQTRVAWWEQPFPSDTPPKGERLPGASQSSPLNDDETVALSPFTVANPRPAADEGRQVSRTRLDGRGAPSGAEIFSPDDADGPVIQLKRWSPESGYLQRLQQARPERRYALYLEERGKHEREPGFFLDVANHLLESGDNPELALRILSNLIEFELDEPALLRVLGHRLLQAERPELAVPLFQRVLALRADEPQSRRDLALACEAAGELQRAADLLWEIVAQPWDSRFPGIELIALEELNAIISTAGRPLDVGRFDPRLLRNLPVDLRIVLTWDASDCDMDLWVTDPNGETCRYDFPLTYQGGLMSSDFTGGYGPEEFLLRKAKPGKYVGKINYYGDRRQNAFGPVTAQVRFITDFGTPQKHEKRVTVRLKDKQETLEIGSLEVGTRKIR